MEKFIKIAEISLFESHEASRMLLSLINQGFQPMLYEEYGDGRKLYYVMQKRRKQLKLLFHIKKRE